MQYYIVTKPFLNPKFDGRAASNCIKSVRTFEPGRVLMRHEHYSNDKHEMVHTLGHYGSLYPFKVTPEIRECIAEHVPSDWDRFRGEIGLASSHYHLLRRILERGLVTFDQMLEIFNEPEESP